MVAMETLGSNSYLDARILACLGFFFSFCGLFLSLVLWWDVLDAYESVSVTGVCICAQYCVMCLIEQVLIELL